MKYVLDTNTLSALMQGQPAVVDRFADEAPSDVWTPQPALAEIAYGISRLGTSKRRRELEQRRDLVAAAVQHSPWTDKVTEVFGQVKAALEKHGTRIEDFDLAIAAHALAEGATLVTTDRHMRRIPNLIVEDWSERRDG